MHISRSAQSRQFSLEEGTSKKLERLTKSFEKKHPGEGYDVARHDPDWQKLQQRRAHSLSQRAAKKGSAHIGQPPKEGYSKPGLQPYSDEDPGTRHTTAVTKGPAWDPSRQSHSADNVSPMSGKREATYKAGTGEPMGRRRGNRKKFFQTTDTGEYANIAESPARVSKTAQALSTFMEAAETYDTLVEWSRQAKKIRAPNLQRVAGWDDREEARREHNRGGYIKRFSDATWAPRSAERENDPEPDRDAVHAAKRKEAPGPSRVVGEYHRRKQRERVEADRKAALERKAAARAKKAEKRAARLKARGLPQDYSLNPDR